MHSNQNAEPDLFITNYYCSLYFLDYKLYTTGIRNEAGQLLFIILILHLSGLLGLETWSLFYDYFMEISKAYKNRASFLTVVILFHWT